MNEHDFIMEMVKCLGFNEFRITSDVPSWLWDMCERLYNNGYKKEEKVTRPKIVCLCGSTRFMDKFFEMGWKFTLKGHIVLSVGVCKHAEHHGAEALGQDVVDQLDELHLRKIDISDIVFVLNVDGYVGESTQNEIDYAEEHNKPVYYLETGHDEELEYLFEDQQEAYEKFEDACRNTFRGK